MAFARITRATHGDIIDMFGGNQRALPSAKQNTALLVAEYHF
ncbi:hypothetical protein [Aquabacterium sp.]|nr:hypothetical protein [Aquabacterium sp.]HSW04484.1 hypothetical protein [Aquabacterium sp.]